MEHTTGDEMFKAIEENFSFKWSCDRYWAFLYAAIQYRAEGKTEKAEQMELEAKLFSKIVSSDASIPDAIPIEAIKYFKSRLNTTNNPIHKACYADYLCLAVPPSKERYLFGKQAVDGYLAIIDMYLSQLVDNQVYEALTRAVQISKIFNYKKHDIAQKITNVIEKLLSAKQYYWISRIADTSLHLGSHAFSQANLYYLIEQMGETSEKLEELAQKSNNQERALNYDFLRMSIETQVNLYKSLGRENEEWNAKLIIFHSYLEQVEIERRVGDRNTVASWLQEAYKYVRQIEAQEMPGELRHKLNEAKNDLKRQITEANIAVYNTGVTIDVEQTIDHQEIDRIVEELLTHDLRTSLARIAVSFLMPIAEIQTEVRDNPSIFKFVHPHVTDHWGKTVSAPKSNEEIFEFEMAREILLLLQNQSWITSLFFERLIQEKGLNTETFMEFLLERPVFKNMDTSVIRCGIDHYFKGDYPATIHLLCPQVEAAFRTVLWLFGGATTNSPRKSSYEDSVLITMSLETILKDELIQGLPDELLAPVRTLFTDPNGLNLRNNLAHGLLPLEMCTRGVAELILQVLLLLAFSIKEVTPDEASSQ